MTSAWFLGARSSVAQDDTEARSTLEPIRRDGGESAELKRAPDFNEVDTDESGDLVGLAPRMLAGHVAEPGTDHYVPHWAGLVGGAQNNHNAVIDEQVSTSGTAAARELAGQQGHGQIVRVESIEPVIRDGAAFGNKYFTADNPIIQDGMGAYMAPADQDNWASSLAQATANSNSRRAHQDSVMRDMWSGLTNG